MNIERQWFESTTSELEREGEQFVGDWTAWTLIVLPLVLTVGLFIDLIMF